MDEDQGEDQEPEQDLSDAPGNSDSGATQLLDDLDAEFEVLSQKAFEKGLDRIDQQRLCEQMRKMVELLRVFQALSIAQYQDIEQLKYDLYDED